MDQTEIGRGSFRNDSEYIRDLIRRDQDSVKFQALQEAVQEGLDSSVSDHTLPQIMEGVETWLRANGRL